MWDVWTLLEEGIQADTIKYKKTEADIHAIYNTYGRHWLWCHCKNVEEKLCLKRQ